MLNKKSGLLLFLSCASPAVFAQVSGFTLTPGFVSFNASPATGSVLVNASASTAGWTATSNSSWLTITSGGSGGSSGVVSYSVAGNDGEGRTGTLTIAGEVFTVTQTGPVYSGDPGITSSLQLVNGTVNGQAVSPSTPAITVQPGTALSGSITVLINSSYPSNDVMAMGATPNWGAPSTSFIDLGGFSTPVYGLTRSVPVNWRAPATPGVYYVIVAFRDEFTAGEVMSCTNWSVGSLLWNDGQAIAEWPSNLIESAINAGSVAAAYTGEAGPTVFIPSTAIRVVVTPPLPAPSIALGGVVPVDSTVPTIQPGEWVSIFGTNLASSTATWNGDFPISLGGTSVTINGRAAYLSFVSPTQINLQAPDDSALGPVPVAVTTAGGTAASTVTLASFAPSFLLLDSKHVAGIILRSNGSGAYGGGTYDILGPTGISLGYPTVAAKAGDLVELFALGLGPTNPAVPAGQPFSSSAPTTYPVTLLVNNVGVAPAFAGASGAGICQINLIVPAGLGTGDLSLVALVATQGGARTPPNVVISLQ